MAEQKWSERVNLVGPTGPAGITGGGEPEPESSHTVTEVLGGCAVLIFLVCASACVVMLTIWLGLRLFTG